MLYRYSGTPFGSGLLMLPMIGVRCEIPLFGIEYREIDHIDQCSIDTSPNYCRTNDRIGISCGGICAYSTHPKTYNQLVVNFCMFRCMVVPKLQILCANLTQFYCCYRKRILQSNSRSSSCSRKL